MRLLIPVLAVLTGCAGNTKHLTDVSPKVTATYSYNNMAVIGAVTAQDALVINVVHICSGLSPELERHSKESRLRWEQRNKKYTEAFAEFWGDVANNVYKTKGSAAVEELFLAVENGSKATAAKFINATIYSDPEPQKACGAVLAMINDGVSDIKNIKQYKNEIESILYQYH